MDEQPIKPTDASKTTTLNNLLVPLSIVIAGGLIAIALYLGAGTSVSTPSAANNQPQPTAPAQPTGSLDAMRAVGPDDHIKGDLNAPIKIVEYSDFECPFCKRFHETMNQVMEKYGDSGEVAWVFRQFPLEQLHPVKAMAEAMASECAAEQGGNDMFWKFTDRMMELSETNNRTDIATVIPQIAKEIGLDQTKFKACTESGKFDQHIKDDSNNAVATGGSGTPWSILVTANGKTFPINGAQPLAAIEQLIEIAKKEQ